jgi:hypothetical protein
MVVMAAAPMLTAVLRTAAPPAQTGSVPDQPPGQAGDTPAPTPVTDPARTTPAGPDASPGRPAPTGCSVRRLPDSDRVAGSVPTGVDPTGRYVLGRSYPDGKRQRALLWVDGEPMPVDLPGLDQSLRDANSAGLAVGASHKGDEVVGWAYRAGKATMLAAKTPAEPSAVGEHGVIVGSRALGRDELNSVPVIWRSPGVAAADLPRPAEAWYGTAVDVTGDGTVVGALAQRGYQYSRGFLWEPDGSVRTLPLPTVDGRVVDGFVPVSVGDRWIAGKASFARSDGDAVGWTPMRYDRHTGGYERYPVDEFAPVAGNADGWLVGQTRDDRPALLTGAGLLPLPEAPELTGHLATGVSADGSVIVGQAYDAERRVRALMWRCR